MARPNKNMTTSISDHENFTEVGSQSTSTHATSNTTSSIDTVRPAISNPLPPLLALPVELQLHIFSYLEGPEPALIILRRTHPLFRSLTPKGYLQAQLSKADYHTLLVAAEVQLFGDKEPNLFPPDHLACFKCYRVLQSEKFSDRQSTGSKRVGGKAGFARFCITCGIYLHRYSPGDRFNVKGVIHTIAWCVEVDSARVLAAAKRHCIDFEGRDRYWRLDWAADGRFKTHLCVDCIEPEPRLGDRSDIQDCWGRPAEGVDYRLKAVKTGNERWEAGVCSRDGVQLWQGGRQFGVDSVLPGRTDHVAGSAAGTRLAMVKALEDAMERVRCEV